MEDRNNSYDVSYTVPRHNILTDVKEVLQNNKSLLIVGEFGIGKTHLVKKVIVPWLAGQEVRWAHGVGDYLQSPLGHNYIFEYFTTVTANEVAALYVKYVIFSENADWIEEIRSMRGKTLPLQKEAILFRLTQIIPKVVAAAKAEGFYLIIDELDLTAVNAKTGSATKLLNAMAHTQKAGFIVTASTDLPTNVRSLPWFRDCRKIELPSMSLNESERFFYALKHLAPIKCRDRQTDELFKEMAINNRRTPKSILDFMVLAYAWCETNKDRSGYISREQLLRFDRIVPVQVEHKNGMIPIGGFVLLYLILHAAVNGAEASSSSFLGPGVILIAVVFAGLLGFRRPTIKR